MKQMLKLTAAYGCVKNSVAQVPEKITMAGNGSEGFQLCLTGDGTPTEVMLSITTPDGIAQSAFQMLTVPTGETRTVDSLVPVEEKIVLTDTVRFYVRLTAK